MTTTMRAMVTAHHGGIEVVQMQHLPVPVPGPGEVLVRVAAAGCNNTDLWTREGSYGTNEPAGWAGPIHFPRIQGGDVAGTIEQVGPGVDLARVGTRALVDPALYAKDHPDALVVDVLGSERDGGFAEYVALPAERVHDVSGSPLSDSELAAMPIAYGTALGMLTRGEVDANSTVLITGASGGVGLAAVQLAVASGARVIAVSSAPKAAAVSAAGADFVVDRGQGRIVEEATRAAPEGYDAVIDVVAGPLLVAGLGLLRPGGRWVVAGALDGWSVDLDVRRLYLANISLVGSTMHTPAGFDQLVDIARRGQVRPVVAATFELEDLPAAQEQLARREHVGKLVVRP